MARVGPQRHKKKVLLHVSMHLQYPQGVLSLYFAKVIKIIRVTNSIKSIE